MSTLSLVHIRALKIRLLSFPFQESSIRTSQRHSRSFQHCPLFKFSKNKRALSTSRTLKKHNKSINDKDSSITNHGTTIAREEPSSTISGSNTSTTSTATRSPKPIPYGSASTSNFSNKEFDPFFNLPKKTRNPSFRNPNARDYDLGPISTSSTKDDASINRFSYSERSRSAFPPPYDRRHSSGSYHDTEYSGRGDFTRQVIESSTTSAWSQEPVMMDRSAYRTILDWSVHPTIQPDDFNTITNSQRTVTKIKRLTTQKASSTSARTNDSPANSSHTSEWQFGSQDRRHPERDYRSNESNTMGSRRWNDLDRYDDDDGYSERDVGRSKSGSRMSYNRGAEYSGSDETYTERDPDRDVEPTKPNSYYFSYPDPNKEMAKNITLVEKRDKRSEYLYTPQVVLPAINSRIRKPRVIYYSEESLHRNFNTSSEYIDPMWPRVSDCIKAAEQGRIKTVKVQQWELDELVQDNEGIVMEATPFKMRVADSIGAIESDGRYALIPDKIKLRSRFLTVYNVPFSDDRRPIHPVWVFIEKADCPIMMGRLIRTAYYMGASGVVFRRSTCPRLDATVSRASGGIVEEREIYQIKNMSRFIKLTRKNGWDVVGIHATPGTSKSHFMQDWLPRGVMGPTLLIVSDTDTISTALRKRCSSYFQIPQLTKAGFNVVDAMDRDVTLGIALSKLVYKSQGACHYGETKGNFE